MTEIGDALSTDAVDVRAPFAVVHDRAFPANEDNATLGVEARCMRILGRDETGGRAERRAHDRITVRTPGSPLADRMTTSSTPPSSASRAASIFTFIRPRASDSASWTVVSATIDRTGRDGRTPSDHFAVAAELRR